MEQPRIWGVSIGFAIIGSFIIYLLVKGRLGVVLGFVLSSAPASTSSTSPTISIPGATGILPGTSLGGIPGFGIPPITIQ
jgi:hypothetical protein